MGFVRCGHADTLGGAGEAGGVQVRAENVDNLVAWCSEGFEPFVALLAVIESRAESMDGDIGVFHKCWSCPNAFRDGEARLDMPWKRGLVCQTERGPFCRRCQWLGPKASSGQRKYRPSPETGKGGNIVGQSIWLAFANVNWLLDELVAFSIKCRQPKCDRNQNTSQ